MYDSKHYVIIWGYKISLKIIDIPEELKSRLSASNHQVNLSIGEADVLRDLCTGKLDVSGFDENYELTDLGKI